jgi:hypothetical protein
MLLHAGKRVINRLQILLRAYRACTFARCGAAFATSCKMRILDPQKFDSASFHSLL